MRRVLFATLVVVCFLALFSLPPPGSAKAMPSITPGGTWISPDNNFVVQGDILPFAAHAYPTNPGDPPIDHVNFTATWPGANWHVICTLYRPQQGDVYRCNWNLAQAGVPNGPLTVSFDVYDVQNNANLAPNGTHYGLVRR